MITGPISINNRLQSEPHRLQALPKVHLGVQLHLGRRRHRVRIIEPRQLWHEGRHGNDGGPEEGCKLRRRKRGRRKCHRERL